MKGFGKNKDIKKDKYNPANKDKDIFLKNKLDLAKNYLSTGYVLQAKKIYSQLINKGIISYDLLFSYALLSRNCSEFRFAKELLFQSISRYPTKINHYILLAEILRLEKDFSRAQELLLTACKLNPRNSNSVYNLSLLYRDLNNVEDALNTIDKAIKLMPTNYVYKLLKADLLKDLNNFKESEIILQELCSDKKIDDKKDILLMLSTVKSLNSDFKESEKILLKTIELYPKFAQAYLNLSGLYFENKLLKKAKKFALEGIVVDPNIPEMLLNLGVICRNLGEINESKKYLLKAISMNNKLFKCYDELSSFYDFSNNPKELNYLLNYPLEDLNKEDIIRVCFARANIFHRQKNFSNASKYYKIANDYKSKIYPSNKKILIEKSTKIKETFFIDKEFNLNNNLNPQLIFIVGMPRSGSTLLETILSVNQKVCDLGEIEILPDIVNDFDPTIKDQNPYQEYIKGIKKLAPKSEIITDKNLFNYVFCPVINKYFSNSKIILCLRNPLDNILSIYRENFIKVPFSTSIKEISEMYIHHYVLMKSYSATYRKNLFIYNYDDVVVNPSYEIKKIIDWLGWEWTEEYTAPHKNNRSVFTASSEQVRNPIHSNSLRGWKEYADLLQPAIELISKNRDLKKYIIR
jgi:tetratricopeptide (TPR) repeat protein